MTTSKKGPAIGFPPPLLGEVPLRLPIVANSDHWLALNKPAGAGVRAYPWDEGIPNLDGALNQQLQAEKPELVALDAELFGSIYYIEPEVSGVALFGKSRDAIAQLRNAYGSGEFEFSYLCVSRIHPSATVGEVLEADAPLLPHDWKLKMIPSTAKGKRAQTRFKCLGISTSGWALWEAKTRYPRVHQIRAHAAVLGIALLGDALYGGPDVPLLADLMPKKRGPGMRAAIFTGIALHLKKVRLPLDHEPSACDSLAEAPKAFSVMLKRLGLPVDFAEN